MVRITEASQNLVDVALGRPATRSPAAVAELGVDVVSAQDGCGRAWPGIGVLVGQASPAQDADPFTGHTGETRPAISANAAAQAPSTRSVPASCRTSGRERPFWAVEGLEPEASLVAQPAPVDGVTIDPDEAHYLFELDCTATRHPTAQ